MRALRFEKFGDPSVLALVDVPEPKVGRGRCSLSALPVPPSIRATSRTSRVQWKARRCRARRDVTTRASSNADRPNGSAARYSEPAARSAIRSTAVTQKSSFIPVAALTAKPARLSAAQAASVGVTSLVAWLGLIEYAALQPGETVAIIGVGGGRGLGGVATCQMARRVADRRCRRRARPRPVRLRRARSIDTFQATST